MKYNDKNKPLVCMMTQSTCYKGTRKFTPKGVLWHSTGANNPWLKRYVQPDDDAANRSELLNLLGKNQYGNDWNHIEREAGLNFWIGKLADGTVAAVQTMPWDYRPWGCGSGNNGSCNNTHIQFEICEDSLNDKSYWEAVYKEACEMTAYLCKMFGIDPKGTTTCNGVTVPTIIDHTGSHALGLGSNHGDVQHWSRKYGKTMENVRNDVAALLAEDDSAVSTSVADSNLTKGSAGEAVKTMQTMLIACGYSCGATGADGDFGNNTLAAVKAFQKDKGLTVDGIYGPATKTALEKAYASRDTSPVSQSTIAINAEQAIWEFFMEKINNAFGVAGLMGCGNIELAKKIYSLIPEGSCEQRLDGKTLSINSPSDAMSHGIAFVTDDRKNSGIFEKVSAKENATISILTRLKKLFLIDVKQERKCFADYVGEFQIKCQEDQMMVNLSGGNQQKILVSRALMTNCKVLILLEPTRGIDVGAKYQMHHIIHEFAERGIAVIVVSSDLPELIKLSDRVMVMCNGEQMGFLEGDDINENCIMLKAAGLKGGSV